MPCFLGKRLNRYVVNHKNFIKTDNNINNLEYITYKENSEHTIINGRSNPNRGEDNHNTSLTSDQILEIRKTYSIGNISYKDIGKKYNMSKEGIAAIVRRTNWSHI